MDNTLIQGVKQRYGIVGNCEALNRAIEIALKIAPVDLSVLVTGENGVGKESFPRIIHEHSLRKNKKYFAVNCGAIPEGTIDSELFDMKKDRLRELLSSAKAILQQLMVAPYSWTKSVNYLCKHRLVCSVYSKLVSISVSVRAKCVKQMYA